MMQPLFDKLLSSRRNTWSKNNSAAAAAAADCRLLLNIGIGANNADRSGTYFGADQVRILLFRECEWRGRKLLFDSVAARKASTTATASSVAAAAAAAAAATPSGSDVPQSLPKQGNGFCTRNGTGLISETERVACDDVSLLSEMVFGTVAMTYRGPLFKVHALSAPRCIMCTKVFPAPDHNAHKPGDRQSDDNLLHSPNFDSTSSVGSLRNTISHLSSGNFSGNSLSPDLRKNSTCSSNSSGWDIDIPLSSSQSLESNGSSGFGSLTSLRRRWLRAVSTTLSHSELDEIFGIQAYNADNVGSEGSNHRRHKTRLGLAVLIQLTPGHERQMEARLLEHAAQMEGMLNRLCYACIESCRTHGKSNGECKSLTLRMRRASGKCIAWLLRLLASADSATIPSLWHEVIMNSATPVVQRTHSLHRNLQQMCHLLNGFDTKSTNFFLSTIVTAVLTHHLGWVQTVMSSHDKQLMENLGKRYPCNPLWAQLGDLYGALGNPPKLVHTVIAGDAEKTALINAVLSFLSYFIRSAIVEKRRESRCPSQQDVQEAIAVLERMKKNGAVLHTQKKKSPGIHTASNATPPRGEEGSSGEGGGREEKAPSNNVTRCEMSKSRNAFPKMDCAERLSSSTLDAECKIVPKDQPQIVPTPLKRTRSAQKNLAFKSLFEYPVKVDAACDDDDDDDGDDDDDDNGDASVIPNAFEKDCCPLSTVKIIVSETTSDAGGTKKRFSPRAPTYNLEEKTMESQDSEVRELTMDAKLTSLERRTDSGFDSQKLYPSGMEETEAFFARLDLPKDSQQSHVLFTLGEEEKLLHDEQSQRPPLDCNCQCSFAFTRMPSTSAELPEGVLRKIIQRNFPESSKSIERPDGSSLRSDRFGGTACPKCNGAGYSAPPLTFEGRKLLLETPTNATEVLRTCANSVGSRAAAAAAAGDAAAAAAAAATRLLRSNSLEALMEASNVVELPMPRSKKVALGAKETNEVSGFTKTLLQRRVTGNSGRQSDANPTIYDAGYTSGLVIQGLTKKRKKRRKDERAAAAAADCSSESERDWLSQLREEVNINARYPVIDQPISEALCILADLDNWQVGILSNSSPAQNPLLPVGMSRLVATMLESFAYLWTKYRSPRHCIEIFECKLREMWLRSEALAEMLLAVDVCDVTIASLTKALDLDAADIPLLLAVATTHSPQIAQRFGLSLA